MSFYFISFQIDTLDWRDIDWRRHVLDDRIKKLLYTFVLVCRTTAYRNSCTLASCLTKCFLHVLYGRFFSLKVHHH